MRIVAVADTHTFEADLGQLPVGDVFIHAGDMLQIGTLEELAPVARWITELPYRHKIVVAGNHDWCFVRQSDAARSLLRDVVYLEDTGAVLDGVRFWGSPWQPAFNDWAFNLARGEPLAAKWALIPAQTDVLITHGPPVGFGDRISKGSHAGCADLLAAVERLTPPLHLFGHIHEDGGSWRSGPTCLANATTREGRRGATVIDFDPVTRTATEVHIPARKGTSHHVGRARR